METEKEQGIRSYDVVIIGGGIGGFSAAIRATQEGLSTALVERNQIGGVSLNFGCTPIKYLLKNIKLIRECAAAKKRGLVIKGMDLELARMMRDKNQKIRKYGERMQKRLEVAGVDIYMGDAKVSSDRFITIDMGQGIMGKLDAKRIILAMGSSGSIPNEYRSMPNVMTDEEAHQFEKVPTELVIIGTGIKACEYATLFSILGARVTLFVEGKTLLPNADVDVQRAVEHKMMEMRVETRFEVHVSDVYKDSLGDIHLDIQKGEQEETVICSDILLIKGRQPNLTAIDDLDLQMEDDGIVVNQHCETSIPGIYAVGDVVTGIESAAESVAMAIEAVDAIMEKGKGFNRKLVPRTMDIIPEVASVGLTETEARATGRAIHIDMLDLKDNLRLFLDDASDGFVKLISDESYGELLGVSIVGNNATEIIAQAQSIMSMEGTIEDLKRVVHPYPSASSALSEAAFVINPRVL